MFKRFFIRSAAILAAAALTVFIAHQFSPWPAALFYRALMDMGGVAMHEALAKHVPGGVAERRDLSYGQGNPDAVFDVFYPAGVEGTDRALPTVVWIHGGGFLSGSKDQIANYLKIIAAKGYTVVGLNYGLAPAARYPEPVKQLNEGLRFVLGERSKLHIDPAQIFLAGDSAGAQLAGQIAAITSSPEYATQVGVTPALDRASLRGVILHCGLHDPELLKADGGFGGFVQAVGWSYFGAKDFLQNPVMEQFSVVRNVTPAYPPAFISVGNADPLKAHSTKLAARLKGLGVAADELYFADDYEPPLPHEYQFNLDGEAGKLALERTLKFLEANSSKPVQR